jgi:polyisoprenoid-binding protein YceI
MRSAALALLAVCVLACGRSEVEGKAAAEVSDVAPATGEVGARASASDSTVSLDKGRSRLSFVAATRGGDRTGNFSDLDGSLTYSAGTPSKVSFDFALDSVSTGDATVDDVLRKSDFFNATKYARPQFVSTSIVPSAGADGSTHRISGVLTMHGTAKNVAFSAKVTSTPAGIRAQSEFTIDRRQWNLNFPGSAAALAKDEALIRFDLYFPPAAA